VSFTHSVKQLFTEFTPANQSFVFRATQDPLHSRTVCFDKVWVRISSSHKVNNLPIWRPDWIMISSFCIRDVMNIFIGDIFHIKPIIASVNNLRTIWRCWTTSRLPSRSLFYRVLSYQSYTPTVPNLTVKKLHFYWSNCVSNTSIHMPGREFSSPVFQTFCCFRFLLHENQTGEMHIFTASSSHGSGSDDCPKTHLQPFEVRK
jgi:hypothetical protein